MKAMKRINKQEEVSREGGNVLIRLIWMEVEIMGDCGDYVRFRSETIFHLP